MLSVPTNKEDLARRTEEGRKNIAVPNPGTGEHAIRPTGCADCTNRKTHAVCQWIGYELPHGSNRNSFVPEENRITAAHLNKIQQAVFAAYQAVQGLPINEPYNAGGGGNNATQAVVYEITGASGTTLSLKGRNPKRIELNNRRVNPEWLPGGAAGADPVTGETSRLVNEERFTALPAGAVVEFLFPSCLAGKLFPTVLQVNPPESDTLEDVSFSVECSSSVTNARVHQIVGGRGPYFCAIHWEAFIPSRWLDLQAFSEVQWTVRQMTFANPGNVGLLDSLNNPTRVLYPSHGNHCAEIFEDGPITVTLTTDGIDTELSSVTIESLLETVQIGEGEWTTTIDLSAYSADSAVVRFTCTATPLDSFRKPRLSQCRHSKTDHSGSYDTEGGQVCANTDNASLWGSFEAGCWQPECTGFDPDCSEQETANDSGFWSSLYSRANWLIQQGIAGVSSSRNFQLTKPSGGGPSLQGLVGSLENDVPIENLPYTEEYKPPVMGTLEEWTDENGDDQLIIRRGLFWAEALADQPDGGPDLRQAVNSPDAGLLSLTNTLPSKGDTQWIGGTNIGSDWGHSGSNGLYAVVTWANSESYAVALPRVEDGTLSARIEGFFP
jgi:hypothetical protein